MKIFHRVLAMVLALIMAFAVLPLGTFAAEPWIEVGSGTQTSPDASESENPTVVVKVNADKLVEILQTSGLSSALLEEIQSGIVIDIAALLEVITVEEILDIIPADAILSNIGLADLIAELGDKVDVYFDLGALIGGFTNEELEAIVKKDDALTVIMDYYKKTENGGLDELLSSLLSVEGEDADGDHVPDNCPIYVHKLANALTWTKACFNENIYDIDFESYIEEGLVSLDDFLACWPKELDENGNEVFKLDGILDVENDILLDDFIHAAEEAGRDVVSYIRFHEMLEEHPELASMIENDPDAYLTEDGMASLESWLKAAVEAKGEWTEGDLNVDALVAKLMADDATLTENTAKLLIAQQDAKVVALIEADPKAYLSASAYTALSKEALTDARVETLIKDGGVDLEKLRADAIGNDYVTSEEFNDYILINSFIRDNMDFLVHNATSFLKEGVLAKIHENINIEELIHSIHFDEIIRKEGLETILSCLNLDAVISEMEAEGKMLTDYVDLPLAINALGVDKLLTIINDAGKSITELINIDAFVEAVDANELIAQLSPEAIADIWESETVTAALPRLQKLMLAEILYDIDLLKMNGRVVASEDTETVSGRLIVDINAVLGEIIKQLPTLEDIAKLEDGTLLSFDLFFEYETEDGETAEKAFGLEFVLDGDIEMVKSAASKLNSILSNFVYYEINPDLSIVLEINVPAQVMTYYAEILMSADLDAAEKEKLLNLTSSSMDAVGLLNTITLDELVLILEGLDSEKLLDKIAQISYVEAAMQEIAAASGKDISELTTSEILAGLDDTVDKAGENSLVSKIYTMVEEKFGFNPAEVLDQAELMTELEDIVNIDRETYEDAFVKIKNYVSLIVNRISSVAPGLLDKPLSEMYQGNGVFYSEAEVGKDNLNAQNLAGQLAGKLFGESEVSDEMVDLVRGFFPEDVMLNVTAEMTVNFKNFYRVTYHDINSKPLLDVFMPAGTDLSAYAYAPDGFTITGWRSGVETVDKVTGDMLVYPIFESADYTTVQFNDADGNVFALLPKKIGDCITEADIERLIAEKAHDQAGYELIWAWVQNGWYLSGDEDMTPVDFSALVVEENMVFEPIFEKTHYDEVYGEYTHPIVDEDGNVDGYIISKDDLLVNSDPAAETNEVVIMLPELLVEDEGTSITLEDPSLGVSVTVDHDTLDQMDRLGNSVAFVFCPNDEFDAGHYNHNNSVQYTLDFLIGYNKQQVPYSTLLGDASNFKGEVSVTLPFEAIEQITGTQGTFVYHVDHVNGEDIRTLIPSELNYVDVDGVQTPTSVTFSAPHFSDFVIANEYAVYHRFVSVNTDATVTGTVDFMDDAHVNEEGYTYLPVGAVEFEAEATSPEKYEVIGAYVTEGGFDGANKTEASGSFKVEADKVLYLTIETEFTQTYKVTFIFKNEVYEEIEVRYGRTIGEDIGTPDSYFDIIGNRMDEYGFSYWKDKNGNVYEDVSNISVTDNLTFIGKAEKVASYHKVSFLNCDGELYDTLWVKHGEKITAEQLEALGVPTKSAATDGTVRYDFASWLDADGGVANFDVVTIGAPTSFTADFDAYYRVNLYVGQDVYQTIWVKEGTSLGANSDYIAMTKPEQAVTDQLNKYLFQYAFDGWKLGDNAYDTTKAVTAAIDLTAQFKEDHWINQFNPSLDISAGFENHTYVIEVSGNFETVVLPTGIKAYVDTVADASMILRLVDADGNKLYDLLTVGTELFKNLYAQESNEVSVSYKKLASFSKDIYNHNNAVAYEIGFTVGDVAYELTADDELTVIVPFDWNTDNARPQIFEVIAGDSEDEINNVSTGADRGTLAGVKVIRFTPNQLGMWILLNEYRISDGGATHGDPNVPALAPSVDATISGFDAEEYYVAGMEVTVTPSKVSDGYTVAGIYYVDANGNTVNLTKTGETEWKLIVPNGAVTLKASLLPKSYKINYYVMVDNDGSAAYEIAKTYLYNKHMVTADISAAHFANLDALLASETLYVPAAYAVDSWIGYDESKLGAADMNVYLTFSPIEYTLNLVDPEDESIVTSIVFTAETTDLGELLIPVKSGYTATCPAFATFDVQVAIAAMIEAETTETSLEIVYTPCEYMITYDETKVTVSGDAIYGSEIAVEVIEKEFHKATLEVFTVNGDKVSVKDGKFTMPAASVKIVVTYTATGNAVYYINNRPYYGAMVGDVVTFEVRFTNGYCVASVSDCCTLVNTMVEDDMYVLVYAFDVVDGMRIEYAIEAVAYDDKNIINGSEHQGTGTPSVNEDKVTFNGWSADLLGAISFATFGVDDASSLVWLWILLVAIVLIVLLAILYKLFTLGKLKNNFITRFVSWIVSGFLAICRFVARIGLGILRIFGKKEEDFDYSEPEEEAVEAEEAPAETAEEANEEVGEETTEDEESEDNA